MPKKQAQNYKNEYDYPNMINHKARRIPLEKISFKGWENCYKLSSNFVELIVTADVGPRIIHFSFPGDNNMFAEIPEQMGQTGGDEWQIYGGHRFWHAPEAFPRTYFPDNVPVEIRKIGDVVRVTQGTEATTGLQKELDISLSPNNSRVKVVHRLYNHNVWPVELAPWALSVMAPGGTAVLPLPTGGEHSDDNLLPTANLVMWSYTRLNDPRWTWGNEYILLRQDANATTAQKIGANNVHGWAGYVRNGRFFLKTFAPYDPKQTYPDNGSSTELFTEARFLEVESLGPLVMLQPGKSVEYTEKWYLFPDIQTPTNDAEVNEYVLPKVKAIL